LLSGAKKKERPMKYGLAGIVFVAASVLSSPSHADAYRWCAVYHANEAPLCYFKSLEECRNATHVGGGCSPNLAFDPNRGGLGRRNSTMRY
jgi:hypothetical protein